MNEVLKIKVGSKVAAIVHGVMAYDRSTDDLVTELDIPLFLDSLALKIAGVPAEDAYGALSYSLNARQVDTFRFLLGLEVNLDSEEYFLEAVPKAASTFSRSKLEAVEKLAAVSKSPRQSRWQTRRISERELVLPTLCLLEAGNRAWLHTAELIRRLTELLAPSDTDAKILTGRYDTYFSQKVRNLISHRDQDTSFIKQKLAEYNELRHSLRITDHGRAMIRALRA
jgi:hypothetical protein